MRKNTVKSKLQNGETVIGCFQSLRASSLTEMIGHAGFDFVLIDAEHGPNDISNMDLLVTAADAIGIVPIIRVRRNDYSMILRALDIGALGIQVPQVNTMKEEEEIISAAYYTPIGNRGFSTSTRAANHGFLNPKEYVEMANNEVMTISQIESKQAVDNIDELLKVDGIDVFFIGPTDLSQSMGYVGEPNHPVVQETISSVVEKITQANKIPGILIPNPEAAKAWISKGVRYIVVHSNGLMKSSLIQFIHSVKS